MNFVHKILVLAFIERHDEFIYVSSVGEKKSSNDGEEGDKDAR